MYNTNEIPPFVEESLFKRLEPVLVTLVLTGFVAATYGFGFYLFSAIVPDMRASLGFSYTTVGIITGAAQAGFMLFAIGGALLAHRIGGAWVAICSMVLCSLCLLLIPVAPSIVLIGCLLVVLGGCAASVYVPMVELASRTVSQAHRGKVLGLISSGTSYGVFINGMLIPVFLAQDNWQGIWLTVGVIATCFTVLGLLVLSRAGVLSQTMSARPAVPLETDNEPKPSFIANLRRAEKWVLVILAITFLNGMTTMPFQNYLAPYLREELGFEVALSGRIWALIGFIGMFSGFLLGALSDRIGIRETMVLTYVLLLIAAVMLVTFPTPHFALLAGVSFALAFYPIFGLVPAFIAKTPSHLSGTSIFAIANVTLGVGGIVGNFLGGLFATQTGSFIGIYLTIAALSVFSGLLALCLPKEVRGNE